MDTFNLTWSEFGNTAGETIRNLVSDKDFTDVTLACGDGQQIKAHKVILSSCSPFFRNILVKNPHQHPMVYLKGVSYHQLRYILEFIYLGQTEVDQDSLGEFMMAAKDLQIRGLDDGQKEIISNSENIFEHKMEQEEDVDIMYNDKNPISENFVYDIETYANETSSTNYPTTTTTTLDCDKCDYKATVVSSLNRHKLSKHEGVTYPCAQCDYKATYPNNLKRHTIKVHTYGK